jgi:hypothetical protein
VRRLVDMAKADDVWVSGKPTQHVWILYLGLQDSRGHFGPEQPGINVGDSLPGSGRCAVGANLYLTQRDDRDAPVQQSYRPVCVSRVDDASDDEGLGVSACDSGG